MSVMAPLTALVGLALVALQTTGAIAGWTFVWRDKNGQSYVENGALDKPCTRIQHAVGQRFDWERPTTGPDSASCVKLWSSETCSGSPQGFSCSNWEKSATHNIGAFAVTNSPNVSTISVVPAPSTSTGSSAGATTPAATPRSSVSSGTIAGATVGGAVAAALLIGLAFFLLRLRRRRLQHRRAPRTSSALTEVPPTPNAINPPFSMQEMPASKTHLAGTSFPLVELPAAAADSAELGAERELAEVGADNATLPAPQPVHTSL